jgi:hypothetical protein
MCYFQGMDQHQLEQVLRTICNGLDELHAQNASLAAQLRALNVAVVESDPDLADHRQALPDNEAANLAKDRFAIEARQLVEKLFHPANE